ncbi:MAG: (Fe-S)-binding protein [Opitutaceae bacterium]|nr:(Fe-S)-binding protein [Opitutaceae bacterium]
MTSARLLFTALFAASIIGFLAGSYRRFRLLLLGKKENRFDRPLERLRDMLVYAFGQKRVMAKPFGVNHTIIFWSFLVLLLPNGEFILQGLFPALTFQRLPIAVLQPLTLAFEAVSLLALAAVVIAAARRLFFAPAYLNASYVKARSVDAFLILGFIGILMMAYFGMHAASIAQGKEAAGWFAPVSTLLSRALAGSSSEGLETVVAVCWWIHALVLLAFMIYIPLSKHMHILAAIPNCYFKNMEPASIPPREEFVAGREFGVGRVVQFTWKDLLDGFSCTECGRCQAACPAAATGKSLNPRQIVHDMKVNLLKNGPFLHNGGAPVLPLIGDQGEGSSREDALWACTTCGACMEVCPVLIEQMPKIVKMRRNLVETHARFPEELLNLFENMEQRSNPWGIAPTERAKWCSSLAVKPFVKGETEYLFFVGCAGAFDARNKGVSVALATVLNAAGVSWGILGKDEKCCGDSLRRLGNEYVFDKAAKENVAQFNEKGVTKVITQCPHCYHTLKNDYRQYGANWEILHHSEFIARLLKEGKLKLKLKHKVSEMGRSVIHDSCYLGRHNGLYEAPREVFSAATGAMPGEMARQKEDSFCCGAGGGRMWMEECSGERINLARVKESLEGKPDTICVSCPYCLTMFEDGLKDIGADRVRVKDIAEVVAAGLGS